MSSPLPPPILSHNSHFWPNWEFTEHVSYRKSGAKIWKLAKKLTGWKMREHSPQRIPSHAVTFGSGESLTCWMERNWQQRFDCWKMLNKASVMSGENSPSLLPFLFLFFYLSPLFFFFFILFPFFPICFFLSVVLAFTIYAFHFFHILHGSFSPSLCCFILYTSLSPSLWCNYFVIA